MNKLVAAINLTLDGFCDITVITPDEEIHQQYTDLINNADVILYGRTTYQLMQFWQPLATNPSGEKSMNDFALAIDKIQKIVYSHTFKNTDWDSAKIADQPLEIVVKELKQSGNGGSGNILVGSRSLIILLMNLNLIDKYQFCIHPVVAAGGLPLFDNLKDRIVFKLVKTKIFRGGAVTHYYEPIDG